MKPKFEMGQGVSVKFKGDVDGFPVEFTHVLYVAGIMYRTDSYKMICGFKYLLKSSPAVVGHHLPDRDYWRHENDLTPLEPIVEALVKANGNNQPQAKVQEG